MAKESGIYKLVHRESGHFYIGSSSNLKNRLDTHLSAIRLGKAYLKIQQVSDKYGTGGWRMQIVQQVPEEMLEDAELNLIKEHIENPLCLNTARSGRKGVRGMKKNELWCERKSVGMIGKNLRSGFVRDVEVEFVSPEDVVYRVRNISAFAKEHGLVQSAMNSVAQRKSIHHKGWRLRETPLESLRGLIGVPDILKKKIGYETTVVHPDGREEQVYSISEWIKKHGLNIRAGGGRTTNEIGQSYHIKGMVDLYDFRIDGQMYYGISNLRKFAEFAGVSYSSVRNLISGKTAEVKGVILSRNAYRD